MRRFAVLGLVVVAAFVAPLTGTASAAETVASAGDIAVYVYGPGNDSPHNLLFHLYPQRGIATVSTSQGFELSEGTFLANSYAISIPKGPFEGSIDLKFPGVGEVVGTVTAHEPVEPELPSTVCGERDPTVGATFKGTIRFRGIGGYASWTTRKAIASIAPECHPPPTPKTESAALFGALTEYGPHLFGPAGFAFFARSLSPRRYIEFIAFGDRRSSSDAGLFVAIDKEWLGDVATERVVSLSTKRFSQSIAVGPGGEHPTRVAFAPPAPFFGHGTYTRRTGKLHGSLGVRFLGLKLHLLARPLEASLTDEEPEARLVRRPRLVRLRTRRAAKTEVQPADESLSLILVRKLPGTRPDLLEGTHALSLVVYPLRGIAVATTASNNYEIENKEAVSYVERIPKGPFDGHLDLDFKGLGTFVGDFTAKETSTEKRPKGCTGPPGSSQVGDLDGSIEFHGGGFRSWSASHATAFLQRSPRLDCRRGAAEREPRPKSLFGYLSGGYGSFNHWRYSLRAELRRPHRITELAVFRYEGEPAVVNFDANTYEWLSNKIAARRLVFRSVRGGAHLEVSHGGHHPEHATLRPPRPYSGIGIYTRATHRLTGSLAVQFPGLKLRLGGTDTVAGLFDEAAE